MSDPNADKVFDDRETAYIVEAKDYEEWTPWSLVSHDLDGARLIYGRAARLLGEDNVRLVQVNTRTYGVVRNDLVKSSEQETSQEC